MTKHSRPIWMLLLWSCVGTASAEPPTYLISSERSEIFASAGPDLQAPFWMFTDRHVVRAKQLSGSVRVDPNDVTSCRVELAVRSRQLDVDPPDLRAELGWEEATPDDRASIRNAIEGEAMLWVDAYPTITFRADRCRWLEGGRVALEGKLNIRGVDKPIDVPLSVSFEGDTFEAKGTFEIQHEDFGMQPYANALGTIKIGHIITFVVRVVGIRSSGADLEV